MDELIATMQAFLAHDSDRTDRADRTDRRGSAPRTAASQRHRLRIIRAGITLDLFGPARIPATD